MPRPRLGAAYPRALAATFVIGLTSIPTSSEAQSVSSADLGAFDFERLTEARGQGVWRIRGAGQEYRIPEQFVATVSEAGVAMAIHWPSATGIRAASSIEGLDARDLINIFFAPQRTNVVDSYERFKDVLGRYQSRPASAGAGLVEYYSVKSTGEPAPHYYASMDERGRTPMGNPFLCSVIDPMTAPAPRCSTELRLADGGSLSIRFDLKHLAQWNVLFPRILAELESFKMR